MSQTMSKITSKLHLTTITDAGLQQLTNLYNWLVLNVPRYFEYVKTFCNPHAIANYSGIAFMMVKNFKILDNPKFHLFLENLPAIYPACVLFGKGKFKSLLCLMVYVCSNIAKRICEVNKLPESVKFLTTVQMVSGLLFAFTNLTPAILSMFDKNKTSNLVPVFLFLVSFMYSKTSNPTISDYYSKSASICGYVVAGNLLE